jgi:hypothetical protein
LLVPVLEGFFGGGGGVNECRGGRISAESEFEVVSVAVRMGGRVGREFW